MEMYKINKYKIKNSKANIKKMEREKRTTMENQTKGTTEMEKSEMYKIKQNNNKNEKIVNQKAE